MNARTLLSEWAQGRLVRVESRKVRLSLAAGDWLCRAYNIIAAQLPPFIGLI
jgi:hypothetical protein